MEYENRVEALQQRLDQEMASAAALSPGANMKYLGVDLQEGASALLLVPVDGDPLLAAHTAYGDRLEPEIEARKFFSDEPGDAVEEAAGELRQGEILVDGQMRERLSSRLRDAFEAPFELMEDGFIGRGVKSSEELGVMREASGATDEVVERVRDLGSEATGMTERELACRIEAWLEEEGADSTAFDTVVAAGENAADPHHDPSNRLIARGEPVVLDFGAWIDGYAADQTRTLVFAGEPSEKFREIFGVVKRAQQAGIEKIGPGVAAGEVHGEVSEVIEEAGYGDEFVHSTGHGVGLEVHEHPRIGEGSEAELEKGMTVTVEPGIYVEGELGVRVEDLVLVTDEGCERLNRTPREWKI